ncbi:transmembrane prolyl 4-hydroxylase-like isoform X1 [Nerophis lumbriciformis]|uniref:transmembrane prolyl 4-hydroxylase-like isoform X1 n=2 Tax=Nerophis lumbriciformis TaxID=546530 RepID=UPI002AE01CD0|nr:transmembrane prolyl 4-hydroxylase-like isoform X1 [Nerophis lumbriciformis]
MSVNMSKLNMDHLQQQDDSGVREDSSSLPPLRSIRPPVQRSSVCSRAYFVVVMVFFHVYILNVIALLMYVHYNNGHRDPVAGDEPFSSSASEGESPPLHPTPPEIELRVVGLSHHFRLPRTEGIRVGHVQAVSLMADRTHKMKTLSLKPLLFEIPGFLSEEECRVVVQLAQLKGLMESQMTEGSQSNQQDESNQPLLSLSTEEVFSLLDLNQDGLLQKQEIVSHSRSQDGTWLSPDNLHQILTGLEVCSTGMLNLEEFKRVYDVSQSPGQEQSEKLWSRFKQRSKHTWLYQGPGSHHVLQILRSRVTILTRLPTSLVEMSEPLQVFRYDLGDFSDAHHDSSSHRAETTCTHTRLARNASTFKEVSCRYLTVLIYLNPVEEGGETTFPVADNRTYDEQALIQDGVDLTDTRKTCGRGNLKIKPTVGTALLLYNHLSDGQGWMGELDEYSLHGDCPVKRGLKWVANLWVNVDPDHQQQARYQRLFAERYQAKSGMEEHSQPLSHIDLHQDL